MLRAIGALTVYGFALFGLGVYLRRTHDQAFPDQR